MEFFIRPARRFVGRTAIPLAAVCIFLASFVSHIHALRHYFVLDDFSLITENRFLRETGNAKIILSPRYFIQTPAIKCGARPLTVLSLMLDYRFWKKNPFGYHLVNNLLHAVNAVLVFLLALGLRRRWCGRAGPAGAAPAAFAALIFALHPVQAEAVNIASFRADLLVGLCFFAALLFFMRAIEERGMRSGALHLFAAVLFAAGLFAKENAVTLPLVMWYLLSVSASPRRGRYFAGVMMAAGAFFLQLFWSPRFLYPLHTVFFPNIRSGVSPLDTPSAYVNTLLISVLHYLEVLLVPLRLSIDYSLVILSHTVDPRSIAVALVLIAAAAACYYVRDRFFRFGAVMITATYLPVSNIIPLVNTVSDRYLYLPVAGFALIAAWLLFDMLPKVPGLPPAVRRAVHLAILVFYAGATLHRNPVFQDNQALYRDAVRVSPENPRVRFNLGMAYIADEEYLKAIEELRQVMRIDPLYQRAKVTQMMGFAYEAIGDAHTARTLYQRHLYMMRASFLCGSSLRSK